MTQSLSVDIAIFGGGIAGLWLLNRLCNNGYHAVLFEHNKLATAQTMASQGMIHGGVKYALGGALTGASEAIADMPAHWRRCLDGQGDVDLRGTRVLSDHFYLWSTSSISSRMTAFFASKLTRGRVESVARQQHPEVFQDKQFSGKLYRLVDLVLDVPSMIEVLRKNYDDRIFTIDWQTSEFQQNQEGSIEHLRLHNESMSTTLQLQAKRFILSAGEGNQALMDKLNIQYPIMQRRPLRQVLVKHRYPYALYAHCMGSKASPRLTVSSHQTSDGQWVWYLGGDLATESASLTDEQTVSRAKKELRELFTWLDFSDSQWSTLYVNRAEPRQKNLVKPDQAFAAAAKGCANAIVTWPTKLTLAPNLATQVCDLLSADGVHPGASGGTQQLGDLLDKPLIETPCWETAFDE